MRSSIDSTQATAAQRFHAYMLIDKLLYYSAIGTRIVLPRY